MSTATGGHKSLDILETVCAPYPLERDKTSVEPRWYSIARASLDTVGDEHTRTRVRQPCISTRDRVLE
jgi:hypothetical protein